jgi:hypothetical protein
MRSAYNILFEKYVGKGPLCRLKHRWENILGMDLRK